MSPELLWSLWWSSSLSPLKQQVNGTRKISFRFHRQRYLQFPVCFERGKTPYLDEWRVTGGEQ